MESKTSKLNQYIIIVSILALTGFEYFYRATYLIIPFIIYLIVLNVKSKIFIDYKILIFSVFFIILLLVQSIFGYNRSIGTSLYSIALIVALILVVNTKIDFVSKYVTIIYIFSIVSLVFFTLTFKPEFINYLRGNYLSFFTPLSYDVENSASNLNIIVYNFKDYYYTYNRNSGPFWEPGMFVVFLNIALYLNLFLLQSHFSFRNLILVITILTTSSTTGYICLAFIIIIFLLRMRNTKFRIVGIFLFFLFIFLSWELDFMSNKLLSQIANISTQSDGRFSASVVHYEIFQLSPLIGVGDGIAKFSSLYTKATSTANGLSLIFAKFGIVFGFIYFSFLFLGSHLIILKNLNKSSYLVSFGFFGVLIILAFSQDITIRIFYFFIMFIGFSSNQKYEK